MIDELEKNNIEEQNIILDDEPQNQISSDNNLENNTSNCLALTIKKDYKLTSVTNVVIRSLRMSFKVFVSYVTLNIIKLFF